MATDLVILLNRLAGRVADVALAPIGWMPGWLSVTLAGGLAGVAMLWMFKYTSPQRAIKRTRDRIKSNLLALSLFRDDLTVALRCQGAIVAGAGRLLLLALVPMLVMALPMTLFLGQLGLWYQARPLRVGEEAVVTVQLAAPRAGEAPDAVLAPSPAIEVVAGPVRVPAKNFVCWNIAAARPGRHELTFHVGGQSATKQLPVGDGFMPTSIKRPGRNLSDIFLHPREEPFARDSAVQSIGIAFPQRRSWTCGADWWVGYWFIVSLVAAFAARPFLNVNI